MSRDQSVPSDPTVSDERIRNALRFHIDKAINVRRTTTRAQLAADSGVNIYTIDAILSRDAAKKRRVAMEDGFSLAHALGEDAVSSLLSLIGYAARPLDEATTMQPMLIAATTMQHLSTIATAAADGRFDHIEMPSCREAADIIIATVLPLSSAGGSQ